MGRDEGGNVHASILVSVLVDEAYLDLLCEAKLSSWLSKNERGNFPTTDQV